MCPDKRQIINNLLLISGSGRNCGKTTLACEIIANMARTTTVYALKISPHFHKLGDSQELLTEQPNYSLYRENDPSSAKDSSRMLKAGAKESLFLQCEDEFISEAFQAILTYLPKNYPLVCESGSLIKSYKPGLFLVLEFENSDQNKKSFQENKSLSDKLVRFDGKNFSLNINQINFNGKTWNLERKG